MKYFVIYLACAAFSFVILSACGANAVDQASSDPSGGDSMDIMSNLYQQKAAEYKALCLQAYNLAQQNVSDSIKAKRKMGLPLAVITDLDETALDNSAYEVWLYKHHMTYDSASWRHWCDSAIADTVPGSLSFFNWANDRHIAIFYVSNRDTAVLQKTMQNMSHLGFPQIDADHFYFETGHLSSKEPRRDTIEKKYNVVALLGDNLIDLDAAFDKASTATRNDEVYRLREKWGRRYIVFPNAVYGDWENALYHDFEKIHQTPYPTLQQRDSIRLSNLHGY